MGKKERGLIEFRGTILRTTYFNEGTGYFVVKCKPEGERKAYERYMPAEVTVRGQLAVAPLAGQTLYAKGEVGMTSWGEALTAQTVELHTPNTLGALEAYLASSLEGVGKGLAKTLVERYEGRVLEVIEASPQELLSLPGVGKKKVAAIVESYTATKQGRELVLFMHQMGFTAARGKKVVDELKKRGVGNVEAHIKANPYCLTELWGIGFRKSDEVGKELGVSATSEYRIKAGVMHVMSEVESAGSCGMVKQGLLEHSAELLGLEVEWIAPVLDGLLESKVLVGVRDPDSGLNIVFQGALVEKEEAIGKVLHRQGTLRRYAPIPEEERERLIDEVVSQSGGPIKKLEGSQRAAVHMAMESKVSVLTGGPGAGKTTVTRVILDVLERVRNPVINGNIIKGRKPRIAVCAPTGKAAQRAKEATGRNAMTIHRLLGLKNGRFVHNKENPLPVDVLVVDECSMLDVPLMAALMDALAVHTVVLFVGDPDQLPSVGPGKVLRDLIASKCIATTHLDVTYRQDSLSCIAKAAYEINKGERPSDYSGVSGCDYFWIQREVGWQATDEEKERLRLTIQRDVLKVVRTCEEKGGLNPIRDVQVLAPMRAGLLGTDALNKLLQDSLNPARQGAPVLKRGLLGELRAGDKVMQIRNNYDLEVFNGDVGFVVDVFMGDGSLGANGLKVRVEFEGRIVAYDSGTIDELRLAYAFTIHKSQGSEFAALVLPLDMSHYMMLQRNLFYTGVTRAKKRCYVLGPKYAQELAVKTVQEEDRWTTLTWVLRKLHGLPLGG